MISQRKLHMIEPVYRWSGEYFGFFYNDSLYDKYARYLGWIDAGEVWNAGGSFLGERYKKNYILVRRGEPKRTRPPKPVPPSPVPPEIPRDRIARTSREGYRDALDDL